MLRAWVHRQWPGRCLAFLLIEVLCAALAGAQEPPKTQTPPAPRTIVLPSKAVAGALATLAVLDTHGRLLPQATVELSGGEKVTTDKTGRALFKAPDLPGTLVARISGQADSASTPVVTPESSGSQPELEPHAAQIVVRSYPRVLTIRDRFTIEGSGFRGEADSDRVFLSDQLCFVLASSPDSLVVLPGPRIPLGGVTLRVIVDGRNAGQFPVSAALLDFTAPAETPNAGTTGKLLLHAHGTTERLIVEIRNGSPDVIQLLKGNVERVTTSGGEENSAPVDVRFMMAGNYIVSAKLISVETGQPDVSSARKRLLEARGLASGIWSVRIDRLLLKIDTEPLDLAQIRADLKSLLDDKPAPSLAAALDAAWRELNR